MVIARQLTRILLFTMILLCCFVTAAYLHAKDKLLSKEHPRGPYARRFYAWLCAAIGLKVEIEGELPQETTLIISNHISWADIPVLGSITPVYFLSKAEVRKWPVIGRLAQEAGSLFIKRGDGKAGLVRESIEHHLNENKTILVFPEGTTTDGQGVQKFHSKLLYACKKHHTPIQPITLQYLNHEGDICRVSPYINDDSFPTHLWCLFGQKCIHVRVVLHPVVTVDENTDIEQLTTDLQRQIEAGMTHASENKSALQNREPACLENS